MENICSEVRIIGKYFDFRGMFTIFVENIGMNSEELDYKETLLKLTERLTFITLSVKSKRDLTEEDWGVLQRMHWCYSMGYLPVFYKSVLDLTDEKASQTTLFTDNTTETTTNTADLTTLELFGTDIDITTPEN